MKRRCLFMDSPAREFMNRCPNIRHQGKEPIRKYRLFCGMAYILRYAPRPLFEKKIIRAVGPASTERMSTSVNVDNVKIDEQTG